MENQGKRNKVTDYLSTFQQEISNSSAVIIFLAILSGFIFGGILVILTTPEVYQAFRISLFSGLQASWNIVIETYSALLLGAFGDPVKISTAFQSGDALLIREAINPFFDSLVVSTPYIFTGLAMVVAFRAGVFNIGAEGQLFIGSIFAAWAGWTFKGLPPIIHVPLALLIGALAGGIWGMIPGWLKAKTGAHEVINTIMMNYIAFDLVYYLIAGPFRDKTQIVPKTPFIEESAHLFRFFADPIRFNLGFFIAIGIAILIWFILFRTTWGYELRTVGLNPHASRYAGMNITAVTVIAMSLSGALAGLAGAVEMLGVRWRQSQALSTGYGFDSIALALLAKNHPIGVIFTALLFGFMRSGSRVMQLRAGIPIDIISILQSFIILFIAAPAIIRTIYRLKEPRQKVNNPTSAPTGDK